jgi:hypothetical protein
MEAFLIVTAQQANFPIVDFYSVHSHLLQVSMQMTESKAFQNVSVLEY